VGDETADVVADGGMKGVDMSGSIGHEIERVAIVGSGVIGFSWAHVYSRNGLETRLYDPDRAAAETARENVVEALGLFCELGVFDDEAKNDAAARLRVCERLEDAVSGVQWVHESAPEDLALKQSLFEQLDSLTPPETILASNVSSLSMTDVSERTSHPERCVVVRPTNPPHIIPYCEIIAGEKTAADVVARAREFMLRVGQSPAVVNKDIPGFVLNRLQFALVQEAIWLMREGVASLADIDRCLTDGLGMRWAFTGPFLAEELNSANIEEGYRKYAESISRLWASLEHIPALEERDIVAARDGVAEVLAGRSHDEVLDWRDRMILTLRRQKGLL
jgi:L-gulonate 3-dehydrogenase